MLPLILRRLLQGLVTLWLVITVVFVVTRATGDPIEMMYAGDPRPQAQREAENMREALGLNDPLPVQYVRYFGDLARLDLGQSISTRRDVATEIGRALPYTLRLTVAAFVLAYVVALPLGILVAVRRDGALDWITLVLAMGGVSIPAFWLGLMLVLLFSLRLDWLPASGVRTWTAWVLPVVTLAIPRLSFMTRYIRSNLVEVLTADYLRTARAKGLPARALLWRHALRNALIPIVTLIGLQLGFLVGGSVIIERVFGLPGVGNLLVTAITNRDFPLVQGCVIVLALSVVAANLLVDLLYPFIDPRIRAE